MPPAPLRAGAPPRPPAPAAAPAASAPRARGRAAPRGGAPTPADPASTPPRPPPPPRPLQSLALAAATAALTVGAAAAVSVDPATVVVDAARLVPDGTEPALVARIKRIEASGGPRVRVATLLSGDPASPTSDDLRAAWRPGPSTVVVVADPTNSSLLRVFAGARVGVGPQFASELAARYGNLYERRAGGDAAQLSAALAVLLDCVDPATAPSGGCLVVPGVGDDQLSLTTVFSAAGGFVAGFASRLRSPPFADRPLAWVLAFAPLWGILFFSFGLGPLAVRGAPAADIALDCAAFAGAFFLFRASPLFAASAFGSDRAVLTREGRERVMQSEDSDED